MQVDEIQHAQPPYLLLVWITVFLLIFISDQGDLRLIDDSGSTEYWEKTQN